MASSGEPLRKRRVVVVAVDVLVVDVESKFEVVRWLVRGNVKSRSDHVHPSQTD